MTSDASQHRDDWDGVVVGSGPNGLAAAITLARQGWRVAVLEAKETIGGGARSAELTLPGYVHDVCSAIHATAAVSPFFQGLSLEAHGLEWVNPPMCVAHPLDDGSAVALHPSIEATGESVGAGGGSGDADAYQKLMRPLVNGWGSLQSDLLGPMRWPRHPLSMAKFGRHGLRSAKSLGYGTFRGERARALFAGLAAHSLLPLNKRPSAAFGLVLAIFGHLAGWPFPRGGAQRISDALASYFRSLGGEVITRTQVQSLQELPQTRATLLDLTPKQILTVAGERMLHSYRRRMERYRYGMGAFKVDWALNGPIPWRAQECAESATVHVGGSFAEIAEAEETVWRGGHPERPFVLLAQHTLFDPTRAPQGKHTAWAYCHVPHGSTVDMTQRIEAQIERFAPGFRDLVLGRSVMSPARLEEYNPNYVGGDINGGVQDLGQMFVRPSYRWDPYTTPMKGVYICSSSTPPGGGVHGMCGYNAARSVLKAELGPDRGHGR